MSGSHPRTFLSHNFILNVETETGAPRKAADDRPSCPTNYCGIMGKSLYPFSSLLNDRQSTSTCLHSAYVLHFKWESRQLICAGMDNWRLTSHESYIEVNFTFRQDILLSANDNHWRQVKASFYVNWKNSNTIQVEINIFSKIRSYVVTRCSWRLLRSQQS